MNRARTASASARAFRSTRCRNCCVEHGRWYAPVPTFTGAFVGGVVATNAAGAATFKYGTTRAWVDGLTVVLACGCVLDLERGAGARRSGARLRDRVRARHATRSGRARIGCRPCRSARRLLRRAGDGSDRSLHRLRGHARRDRRGDAARAAGAAGGRDCARSGATRSRSRSRSSTSCGARRADTWRQRDPRGIDVAAIEHLDRRCLEILREDGADRRSDVDRSAGHRAAADRPARAAGRHDCIDGASTTSPARWRQARPTRRSPASAALLDRHGVLRRHGDRDARRRAPRRASSSRFAKPRRRASTAASATRSAIMDARIEKTAADMIVPFDRFGEMMRSTATATTAAASTSRSGATSPTATCIPT